MTDEQYKNLISEIKILNTKLKFVEDDLQEIKELLSKQAQDSTYDEPMPLPNRMVKVEKF